MCCRDLRRCKQFINHRCLIRFRKTMHLHKNIRAGLTYVPVYRDASRLPVILSCARAGSFSRKKWFSTKHCFSEVLERNNAPYSGKFPDQGSLLLGNGNRCIHGRMAESGKDVAGKVSLHDQVHEFFTDELFFD